MTNNKFENIIIGLDSSRADIKNSQINRIKLSYGGNFFSKIRNIV